MNTHLADTLAYRFHVAKMPKFCGSDPSDNARLRLSIAKSGKPLVKLVCSEDRIHKTSVSVWIPYVKVE